MKFNKVNKLWGHAHDKKIQDDVIQFTAGRDIKSVRGVDYVLLPYDIWLNKAHCVMLYKQKIISRPDAKKILTGLLEIEKLALQNKFILDPEKEDVHTNIEAWLIEKYGIESAGKLHTARSRNDQSATDPRLFSKDQILNYVKNLINLVESLIEKGEKNMDTVMPGFSHHQHAMVTTFGHMLLSFASMLLRDIQKFEATYSNIDKNLLGTSVAFGTSFKIDRELTTKYLGFALIEYSGLDSISTRGESETDTGYSIVSMMNHLSAVAQTLIILSTPEFGMVKLSDDYTTGSSIMPQKKNPDTLEVIKAKAAFSAGYLQNLISLSRSSFSGYNRDSQWSKYAIMDLIEETKLAPQIIDGVIKTLSIDKQKMRFQADKGFIGATSLMEIICAKYNLPLRLGKIIIERAIKYNKGKDRVEYEAVKKVLQEENIKIPISKKQVDLWQNPDEIIKNYKSDGSPSLESMKKMIFLMRQENTKNKKWLAEKNKYIQNAKKLLDGEINKILR